ncbi:hypothetical protein ACUY3L_07625 [Corynebacterium mastitidis]
MRSLLPEDPRPTARAITSPASTVVHRETTSRGSATIAVVAEGAATHRITPVMTVHRRATTGLLCRNVTPSRPARTCSGRTGRVAKSRALTCCSPEGMSAMRVM